MNTGQLCVKHASRIVELINARVPLTVEGLLVRGAGGDGNEDAGMSTR